ncbi:MAG: N-formylglutamate amidohydrolase [Paludibacteraceae bacterium]|nr:N-formylglutamate amidohydrolase [Paludibacteraceae bacterium]
MDLCIGFNDYWSKPSEELLQLIHDLFANAGYRVAFNRPYSNSMVPQCEEFKNYKSVMIEVNKSVYLDVDGITISAGLQRINGLLN